MGSSESHLFVIISSLGDLGEIVLKIGYLWSTIPSQFWMFIWEHIDMYLGIVKASSWECTTIKRQWADRHSVTEH